MVVLSCVPEVVCSTVLNHLLSDNSKELRRIRVNGHFTNEHKELLLSLLTKRIDVISVDIYSSGVDEENRIEIAVTGTIFKYNGTQIN